MGWKEGRRRGKARGREYVGVKKRVKTDRNRKKLDFISFPQEAARESLAVAGDCKATS